MRARRVNGGCGYLREKKALSVGQNMYPQPPFTLLQYHIAPLKLDREALQSSFPYESKVDSLLSHHPLVVTTISHHSDCTSINGIKVTDWDIYNDGHVIVHWVEDFVDPAFQTLLYPWYDGRVTNNENENESRTGKDSNAKLSRLSLLKEMMMEQRFFLMAASLVFAGSCLSLACIRHWNRQDGGYVYSKPDDGVLV
ncbi:putative fasciclin-like arabinogalactan protein 20 [Camellia lanceoleosa]|uniref:Fasciclin-like arabinogalactan protein 20 n=1 Tax=Camellia lanceoleosa TaxID=1840588 RepID=A0ACC0H5F2_9ERIC|nr:putative fasciclin-like arabinogalactan protein 20 [Camellia lanceoleosa]